MFKIFVTALSILSLPAWASTWVIDPTHSNIGFTVRHLVTRVSGSFNQFEGSIQFDNKNPELSKVNIAVKTESIFTANNKRDDHLRTSDFLDAKKHPTADFESSKVVSLGKGQFKIEGNLTLKGITKPIVLEVDYLGTAKDTLGKNRGGFSARAKLNRKDFGLTWNQLTEAGNVVVGDEVELNFNIAAVEEISQEAKRK